MASEHNMFHDEEGKDEAGRSRSRSRRTNGKGPKKPPQRGLGVAQLERLRIQESWKKMSEGSSGVLPPVTTLHDHHHHQQQLFQRHPSPNLGFQFQCPQQHVISGNSTIGGSWIVPNRVVGNGSYGSGPPLLVGTPLETSKELSSIPNLHSQPECFDFCLKKTRFNEDNEKGSNARRERTLEIWPNGHDFRGFMPQSSVSSLVGETGDFYDKLARHDSASVYACATPNDESVEVVAVHRRGNSASGRVFMEYEFFPGKDGRGTTPKELELPTIGSVAVGGGEASSITAAAYGDSASNYIDLSLKLSR
ncbi:protein SPOROCYTELESS [Vigna radiata var. radiata]|uniref:Protein SPOROCYTELESS n=1 Tax=Vigna radiata var. radiata TaxID=3916 RepID=A0A3Q0ENL2_VIGRR|nr:protein SPOROCYTELESS [Vigna radiata var. radiata]